jgi:hypothetical protein
MGLHQDLGTLVHMLHPPQYWPCKGLGYQRPPRPRWMKTNIVVCWSHRSHAQYGRKLQFHQNCFRLRKIKKHVKTIWIVRNRKTLVFSFQWVRNLDPNCAHGDASAAAAKIQSKHLKQQMARCLWTVTGCQWIKRKRNKIMNFCCSLSS